MSETGARLLWLDVSKGLGIVLVVVGHVLLHSPLQAARTVADIIYLFHMPLFFLLAGATLRVEPVRSFARRKGVALLVPYGFFLLLLGVPALLLTCGGGIALPGLGIDRCAVMPIKLVLGGSMLSGTLGVFWYVSCLFLALVLAQGFMAWFTRQSRGENGVALAALLLLGYLLPTLVPISTGVLGLGVVPMAAVLVLIGKINLPRATESPIVMLASALAGGLCLMLMVPIDMKQGDYGVPLLSLVGATGLSLLLVRLAQGIAHVPVLTAPLQFVGQRTLVILFLHQAVHLSLRQFGLAQEALLALLSLVVPLLLADPLNRLLAAVTGALAGHLSRKSPQASAPLL